MDHGYESANGVNFPRRECQVATWVHSSIVWRQIELISTYELWVWVILVKRKTMHRHTVNQWIFEGGEFDG